MAHQGEPDPMQEDVDEEEEVMLDEDEAEEIFDQGDDAAMDSGDDEDGDQPMEIQLHNDGVAFFDTHKDSIFCIAQHPIHSEIVATGGGDDIAYIWNTTPPDGPVLPASYESDPQPQERKSQSVIAKLDGQDESVNAICFTLPKGEFVVTATLAGKLSVYTTPSSGPANTIANAKEVEEINWLLPCPNPQYPNTVAFGAGDGSVWVYSINPADKSAPLTIVQTFFLHQGACTAGAWTSDGKLLATVSEDGSLYVWDVFGEAAAAGLADTSSGQAVVSLTGADERFRVDGGLYSVAISPGGGIVAVGGAEGNVRVVSLPRFTAPSATTGGKGAGARAKAGGAKQVGGKAAPAAGQAGQILASLQAQGDGIETLDFSQPPLTLLAAGSVDGSIALFDAAHNFALRRNIRDAHEEEAVIKVEFAKGPSDRPWLLTSCGNDGVVRQWDVRGGTAAAAKGLLSEWRGHRGGGEGGGILGFVQGKDGKQITTAGDDGVSLIFKTA
ncbi:hypothetical protein AMS68_000184 [Peltaster fructicola]|uniref:Anaphase-promoting complex subunit 4 WD40 domain-containing protein n=1 Tax=Peltaster fructicola TaxID=286661 RepID=A0A6H0XIW5_9PEZI|nr:hypothetical protein AMS68_000184 [Peltaster fructicola]